ncbi:uncharacterized protein LOC135491225 [Lineus longissimus]|uniref:uncharacterized protein LOC135491225 n=1 Tax=Lineus longissimus TaxID=88925 RepID=UPI00315CA921
MEFDHVLQVNEAENGPDSGENSFPETDASIPSSASDATLHERLAPEGLSSPDIQPGTSEEATGDTTPLQNGSVPLGMGKRESEDGKGSGPGKSGSEKKRLQQEYSLDDDGRHIIGGEVFVDSSVAPKDRGQGTKEEDYQPLDEDLYRKFRNASTGSSSSPSQSESSLRGGAEGYNANRPESLVLPRPLQFYERQKLSEFSDSFSNVSGDSEISLENLDNVIQAVTENPLHEQGLILKEGGMMAFVAEDLNELVKMSSPMSRGSRTPSSRSVSSVSSVTSSYCSTSVSGMSRSSSLPLHPSPDDIPPIDPHAVKDIETHAKRVADNLDLMMGNLKNNLHKMSNITRGCCSVYKEGIDSTCDSVDAGIKSMYALMAKCEEVSHGMKPIHQLADQIKEIKRLLDLFEGQLAKEAKEKEEQAKKT